jgi:hypothetical protein
MTLVAVALVLLLAGAGFAVWYLVKWAAA